MNGQYLDLNSDAARPSDAGAAPTAKRYLGIQFACCDVYSRVYANRSGTQYVGYCPRCAKRVAFRIGAEGSAARFFTVG